jgi:hypothetical protein
MQNKYKHLKQGISKTTTVARKKSTLTHPCLLLHLLLLVLFGANQRRTKWVERHWRRERLGFEQQADPTSLLR